LTFPNGKDDLHPPRTGENDIDAAAHFRVDGVSVDIVLGRVGSPLTGSDYASLESRWIDRALADRAGIQRVDSLTGAELIGRRGGNYAGIIIPYFRPGSHQVREYRLRRDQPDFEYDSAGTLKERQKYLSPPGRSNMLYLPPGVDEPLLRDTSLKLVVTEGEFKTLALWRLANHGSASSPRFLPVGVSGVYNWRGTIGKTVGPDGSRLDVKGAIQDLDWIAWAGRCFVIAYDADAVVKDPVRIARSELAAHLRGRGATVGVLDWDFARGKASMIISQSRVPKPFSMSLPTSISLDLPGEKTCSARNHP
jgi:hypothetical protein